ncbi:MAG: hypothetical protein Q8Q60_03280 [Candidatus Chromulinivorax sp.]|nr:hypothetical protein [Candidatus Chromulinivorax sp.]
MLTIKPTTSPSADPDPARLNYDATQILFVQDKPDAPQPLPNEPQPTQPQIAARIQGGEIANVQDNPTPKPAVEDIPEPALSDDYKKGMRNQTKTQDQEEHGQLNIIEDAIIDQQEQLEQQITPPQSIDPQPTVQKEAAPTTAPQDIQTFMELQEQRIKSAEILKTIISDFSSPTITKTIADLRATRDHQEQLQPQVQKVVSKKHRPADVGTENLSKVQLSKQAPEVPSSKKKISLQDIQDGFSQFIKNSSTKQLATPTAANMGNSLYFSSTGNAQKDDEMGLKYASYMHQVGNMYQVGASQYIDFIKNIITKEGLPNQNSQIQLVIERSGKIQTHIVQSCGNAIIDNYHIKMIESMGLVPPVPKYLDTPISVMAQIPFESIKIIRR